MGLIEFFFNANSPEREAMADRIRKQRSKEAKRKAIKKTKKTKSKK